MKSPQLAPYYVLTGTATMAMGGIFALLGELRDELGFSESELGVMVAMGFFAGFAAQVGLSRYSDRGHANTMIRTGIVVMAAALVAMSLASSLIVFVVARAVLGLGVGMTLPAVRRLVIVSDPESIGANIGLLAAVDVGGFVAGPVVAGVMAQLFGLRAPFAVLAAVIVVLSPVAIRLPADPGPTTTQRNVVRSLLRVRGVRVVLLAVVGWYVMIGTFEAVWAVLLTDLGAAVWLIGVSSGIITLPMVFLAAYSGRLAQRIGPLRVTVVGVMVVAPCVAAYGFVDSLTVIVIIAVLHGGADAFIFPANQVGVALAAGDELAASAQGLQGAALQLVAGMVALVAGAVYEQWGREVIYVANAVLLVVCALAAAVLARPLAAAGSPVTNGLSGRPLIVAEGPA